MNAIEFPWLTAIILLPLVAALAGAGGGKEEGRNCALVVWSGSWEWLIFCTDDLCLFV